MTEQDTAKFQPKHDIKTLIGKLEKECATGRKGHEGVGVDFDELEAGVYKDDPHDNVYSVLFHRILFEIGNIPYVGHEYVYDEDYNPDGWFSSERQVQTYVNRLQRFCKKYAPDNLHPVYDKHNLEEIEKF